MLERAQKGTFHKIMDRYVKEFAGRHASVSGIPSTKCTPSLPAVGKRLMRNRSPIMG